MTMKDWLAPILACVLGIVNAAYTAHVQSESKQTDAILQRQTAITKQQVSDLSGIINKEASVDLKRLADLSAAIEKFLDSSNLTGKKFSRTIVRNSEASRIHIRMLIASCEINPSDTKLRAAGDSLDAAIDVLADKVADNEVKDDYNDLAQNVLNAWKNFQHEVFNATSGRVTSVAIGDVRRPR